MIVWINGPFGVGKSTLARELCRREPGARTFDPERLGGLLRRTVGLVRPGDYQDLLAWRQGVVALAARQARRADPLIVPMTLVRRAYLAEILDGLRARGHDVRHVLLDVSAPVLVERVEEDPDDGPRAWRLEQLGAYLAARPGLRLAGAVVDTDDLDAAEVADTVEELLAGWRATPD